MGAVVYCTEKYLLSFLRIPSCLSAGILCSCRHIISYGQIDTKYLMTLWVNLVTLSCKICVLSHSPLVEASEILSIGFEVMSDGSYPPSSSGSDDMGLPSESVSGTGMSQGCIPEPPSEP